MTEAHTASSRTYLAVWGWLAGLMLLSVVLSELSILPISPEGLVCIVLGLSTIKALLVVLYYMHLKFDRRLLVLVALFPIVLISLATFVVLSSRFVKL